MLRAEGRGFNAGVDIKEMQRTDGLRRADRREPRLLRRRSPPSTTARCRWSPPSTASASAAASGWSATPTSSSPRDDATFGLPEVDRGALGAATHLARLVPPHLMRALYYTAPRRRRSSCTSTARCTAVVPRDELDDAALEVAREIAAKDTRVIRCAKEALNGIDPQHVHRSYRFEQGFTFELNLAGVADEHRDAFVGRQGRAEPVSDKRDDASTRSSASSQTA